MSQTSLEEILDESAEPKSEEPKEAPPAEETTPKETQDAQPDAEAAPDAAVPAEEEKAATPPDGEDSPDGEAKADAKPQKMVPHAALHEERTKRQDSDKRYNALAEQVGELLPHLTKLGQPQKDDAKADAPKLGFYDDPAKFVAQNLTDLETRFNANLASAVMTLSETQARGRHGDFDEMLALFAEQTKDNPALRQQLRQVPDPGEWAYQFAKRAKALTDLGDPTTAEHRFREKWDSEQAATAAETTQEAPVAQEQTPVPDLPKSLAGKRNAGARKGPAWAGSTPLEEILKPL